MLYDSSLEQSDNDFSIPPSSFPIKISVRSLSLNLNDQHFDSIFTSENMTKYYLFARIDPKEIDIEAVFNIVAKTDSKLRLEFGKGYHHLHLIGTITTDLNQEDIIRLLPNFLVTTIGTNRAEAKAFLSETSDEIARVRVLESIRCNLSDRLDETSEQTEGNLEDSY